MALKISEITAAVTDITKETLVEVSEETDGTYTTKKFNLQGLAKAQHTHGYNDLSGVAPSSHTHGYNDLTGVAPSTHTHGYGDLSGVAPSDHTHALNDLSDVTAPSAGQGNKMLVWNGSAWAPADVRFQSGLVTIENKGVISGCTLTKSTTVIRSVDLAAGTIFAKGVRVPIPQKNACVAIPSNTSGSTKICYVYLALSGSTWEPFCTALDGTVPSGGISLYSATVPNNNTEDTDPYLNNVTLTSTRRLEPNTPMLFASPPFILVAFQTSMPDSSYAVDLDIVSYDGSGFLLGRIYADERAANGFKIYTDGMADNIQVRWTAKKISL